MKSSEYHLIICNVFFAASFISDGIGLFFLIGLGIIHLILGFVYATKEAR